MNKNILILSVLMALSPVAFTNASDQAAPAVVEKPTVAAPTPLPTPPPAPKADVNVVKVDGRIIEKNNDGSLAAYICEAGMDCRKQVLTTKEISDTAAISKEIQASIEKSKSQKEVKKEELNRKEYTNELIADLEDSILDECGIETSIKSRSSRVRDEDDSDSSRPSWARTRNRTKSDSARASVISSTARQFQTTQSSQVSQLLQVNPQVFQTSPQETDGSTECAAEALQEKLDELSNSFSDDLADLGLTDDDLYDLDAIMKNLNKEIKKEKDPEQKAVLELALSKVKALNEKVKITQNITQKFAKSNVLRPAVNDLAMRAGYGSTYLHEIASGTPDLFKGIRDDAAISLIDVYKKQIKSYITLRDSGNLQESNRVGNLATGFNIYMTGRQGNSGKSAAQEFMERHALDSDLNARSVVNDVYKVYSPAAAQIQDYLVSTAAGGAQSKSVPLPGVLSTDDASYSQSYTTEAGLNTNRMNNRLQPSAHTIGRAHNRTQQMGIQGQQGRASLPAPNGPPRTGMRQGF